MKIRSRDMLRPKKFKSKNGNSLCLHSFKFVTIKLVKIVKGNKIVLGLC